MTTPAIERARAAEAALRLEREQATAAILRMLGARQLPAGRVISEVAAETKLDEDSVRSAVWGMLGERRLTMSHDYKLRARARAR